MRFWVSESTYNMQGSDKAFACHDSHKRTYYIPRSQVKVLEREEVQTAYDTVHILIEVPDWIVRKNRLPVFDFAEMDLDR